MFIFTGAPSPAAGDSCFTDVHSPDGSDSFPMVSLRPLGPARIRCRPVARYRDAAFASATAHATQQSCALNRSLPLVCLRLHSLRDALVFHSSPTTTMHMARFQSSALTPLLRIRIHLACAAICPTSAFHSRATSLAGPLSYSMLKRLRTASHPSCPLVFRRPPGRNRLHSAATADSTASAPAFTPPGLPTIASASSTVSMRGPITFATAPPCS